MKLLIVTAEHNTLKWKTLEEKLREISKVLNQVKNCSCEVSITSKEVKPEVVNGRITHKWFDSFSFPLYEQGYDFVILHFSGAQKAEWGINPKLGGSSHTNDGDMVGEAWFWADENSVRKGHNRFVETCLHEISHLIAKGTHVEDMTHPEDEKKGTVVRLFKNYDMLLYLKKEKDLESKKTFLQSQIDKLKALLSQQPAPFLKGQFRITQAFGTPNPIYKKVGHHIGTDYACPIGTPLYAPLDGFLHSNIGKETGLTAIFETKLGTYRFCHLDRVVVSGDYKKGQQIGNTGNSGMSTGSHLHAELWTGKVDIPVLTKDNFKNYLTDITK